MTETRTGPAVRKVVEAIEADLSEVIEGLEKQRETIERLELDARGVNGLSSTLKAQRKHLYQIVEVLSAEHEGVRPKMLGPETPPIDQSVDQELAAEVAEARGGPLARPDPTT